MLSVGVLLLKTPLLQPPIFCYSEQGSNGFRSITASYSVRSSSRVSEPRESGSVLFKITLLLCLGYEFMSLALDG